MEDVKHHFDDIQQAIEFGCYIQPDNYFVSYIFATDSQFRDGAAERPERNRSIPITESSWINESSTRPLREVKALHPLPHRRRCDRDHLAGIGITISNDTMKGSR